MRERELKRILRDEGLETLLSLPMRERELKPSLENDMTKRLSRSPCGSVN